MKKVTSTFAFIIVLSIVLIIFLNLNAANAVVNNSYAWDTFQADAERIGYTESPAPDSNQTFWKFQTNGSITSSPVAAAGLVFVGSEDGYLYAVNATTGEKVWNFWVGQDVGSPTVAEGKVFVTASSGTVFAVDIYTGLEVWNQVLGEEAGSSAPLIVDSRVFVCGTENVFVFNEAVGIQLYKQDMVHATGIKRLSYSNGLIVALVSLNGTEMGVRGFEVKDGNGRFWLLLSPSDADRVRSGLTLDYDFSVAIAGLNGNSTVFALNNMGLTMWGRHLIGVTEAFPAYAYDKVYLPTNSSVYALNVADGTLNWSRPINGIYSASSAAVADGKVYFGLDNGYVYALDAFTGNLVWSYKTDGAIQSSPAISDGLLFVGSNDGTLYAIGCPKLQTFDAGTWDDVDYQVEIQSNTSVTNFSFNASMKQISFTILGQSGAIGFCNVTIPLNLLRGEYSVTVGDSQSLTFEEQTSDIHSFVYFTYTNDVSQIRIEGTEAIPECPLWTPLLLMIALLGVAVVIRKNGLYKKGGMQNMQPKNME